MTTTHSFKLTIIFSIFLTFFACSRSNKDSKNVFNYPLSGQIDTLDPVNAYDAISMAVIYQAYEPLFEYHYLLRPYKLKPLLAAAMPKIDKDGTRYTIKIKEGIEYQSSPAFKGKPRFVKAQDFINQIKRLAFLPLKSRGWWLFDGRIKGLNSFRKEAGSDYQKFKTLNVEGLSAPNDHTLVIELNEPYPQMLNALAMSFSAPVPVEVTDHYKNQLDDVIVGTGPYKLNKWVRNSKVIMTKFKKFRKEFYPSRGDRLAHARKLLNDAGKRLPFIEKIIFHISKESQTRWLQFLSNNLDFLRVPKDNYHSLVNASGELHSEFKDQNIKLEIFSSLTYWWISFNMQDKNLGNNINLRKAIVHSIDVNRYIETFTNNIGLKANSIYPPGVPGYDPAKKLPYKYDLKKAKTYLAKAGFPNGKGLPTLKFDTRGSNTTQRQRAEFFKQELAKIGVNVEIEINTFPAFLKKAKEGKLQFWLDGWTLDYPDAENILQLLTTQNHPPGPNTTIYSNSKFDKKFEVLKKLDSGKEKFKLMRDMENIVLQDLPWSLLYYSREYIIYNNRVKNFRFSDLLANKVKYLKLQ